MWKWLSSVMFYSVTDDRIQPCVMLWMTLRLGLISSLRSVATRLCWLFPFYLVVVLLMLKRNKIQIIPPNSAMACCCCCTLKTVSRCSAKIWGGPKYLFWPGIKNVFRCGKNMLTQANSNLFMTKLYEQAAPINYNSFCTNTATCLCLSILLALVNTQQDALFGR